MKTKNLLRKAFLLLALVGGINSAWATDYNWTFEDYCTANSITGKSNKNIKDKNAGLADVEVSSSNGIALTYSCGANNSVSIMYHLKDAATVDETDYSSYIYMGGSSQNNTDRVFKTCSAISGSGKLTIVYAGTASGTCSIYDADDTSEALATITPSKNSAVQSATLNLGKGKKLLIAHGAKCLIYAIKWTSEVTHSVSAVTSTGTDTYGTVSAASTTVAEGGTTTITAEPASGYKVVNWAVSGTGASISPSGASNSTSTTLTMGTADATVTVTFGVAGGLNVTHTLSNVTATSGATGDDAVSEGAEYEAVFAANSGYILPEAITVTIGGETATAGTAYTWNKATGTLTIGSAYVTGNIVITVTGEEAYTLNYDANGGTGSMDATVSKGSITLAANAFSKSGYTFMGWATTADGDVAYADGAAYTLSADATLYAVWATNDYSFAPTESSGTLSSGDVVATSTGGKMEYTPAEGGSPTLKYSTTSGSNCIEFGGAGQCQVTVTLDKVMKAGTVITLNYYTSSATARGFHIANSEGKNKATFSQSAIGTYTGTYTVQADDGLAGSNVFIIKRNNNAYLNTVSVVNCDQAVAATVGEHGYATFSSAYALDFTGAGVEAYVATGGDASTVTMEKVTGTVAASTGLVLKGDKGSYNIPIIAEGTAYDTNKLWAITSGETVHAAGTGYTNYVLAYQNGSVVFASVTGDNTAVLPAGSAALCLQNYNSARAINLVFGGITGVEAVEATADAAQKDGKFVINGQLVIKKNGKMFNAAGAQMK